MKEPISVLIVDDSALMRNLISKIVETSPALEVCDTAMNGVFALRKIERKKPDIIVLDLEMPEMNGIEFLKERKARRISVPVVILSSIARKGARITMEALSLGASDFIMKPSGSISEDIHVVGDQLISMLIAYSGKYKHGYNPSRMITRDEHEIKKKALLDTHKPAPKATISLHKMEEISPVRKHGTLEIVVIGISTGGPNALRQVFSEISKSLPLPVLVVQHMPEGFTEEFAKSLDRISPLSVKEASDGDQIVPGRVLIAPGNKHMVVEKQSLVNVVRIIDTPPVNGHRPSVDVLFDSVARVYQNKTLAVIMTGMGKDGARNIGRIYQEGGITLAQNEESCIVYGMPRVAVENNYIEEILPLEEIADRISTITKENLMK